MNPFPTSFSSSVAATSRTTRTSADPPYESKPKELDSGLLGREGLGSSPQIASTTSSGTLEPTEPSAINRNESAQSSQLSSASSQSKPYWTLVGRRCHRSNSSSVSSVHDCQLHTGPGKAPAAASEDASELTPLPSTTFTSMTGDLRRSLSKRSLRFTLMVPKFRAIALNRSKPASCNQSGSLPSHQPSPSPSPSSSSFPPRTPEPSLGPRASHDSLSTISFGTVHFAGASQRSSYTFDNPLRFPDPDSNHHHHHPNYVGSSLPTPSTPTTSTTTNTPSATTTMPIEPTLFLPAAIIAAESGTQARKKAVPPAASRGSDGGTRPLNPHDVPSAILRSAEVSRNRARKGTSPNATQDDLLLDTQTPEAKKRRSVSDDKVSRRASVSAGGMLLSPSATPSTAAQSTSRGNRSRRYSRQSTANSTDAGSMTEDGNASPLSPMTFEPFDDDDDLEIKFSVKHHLHSDDDDEVSSVPTMVRSSVESEACSSTPPPASPASSSSKQPADRHHHATQKGAKAHSRDVSQTSSTKSSTAHGDVPFLEYHLASDSDESDSSEWDEDREKLEKLIGPVKEEIFVVRYEPQQGWVGHWNRSNLQDVIHSLRMLRTA